MNNYSKPNYKYEEIRRFPVTEKTDLVLSWMIDEQGNKIPFINKQDGAKASKPFKSHGVSVQKEVIKDLCEELLKL